MDATGTVVEEYLGGLRKEDFSEDQAIDDEGNDGPIRPSASSSVTAPSSPSAAERALFSSDLFQEDGSSLSSPPSSPPQLPSPPKLPHKPSFSFMKRKRAGYDDEPGNEPLSDITANARKVKRPRTKGMKQMQIDLGGEVRKTCRTCDMEYIPSVKEDADLHSKFCAMNVRGVDMGKAFLKDDTIKKIRSERSSGKERDAVVIVDRKCALAVRNKTKKVLEVVNAELSSADIDDEQLWGPLDAGKKIIDTRKSKAEGSDKRSDRFKVFLYLIDDKCVGFCLAEKITKAFAVVSSNDRVGEENDILATSKSSSISVSPNADIALLGISRIWVSKSQRGQGMATDLLDSARGNFFYGVEAPKNLVAFSQPTESGGRLAEGWFASETGWHIYRGDE